MAGRLEDSYFKFLPDEVMIVILRQIETVDLLHLSEAYDCDDFLQDKRLIRTIDLSKRYFGVHNLKWLPEKVNLDIVTTFNVNGLYWVPYAILSGLLITLPNLETLYAIDTKLDLSQDDVATYVKIKKLKKLALTVKSRYKPFGSVPHVETIYVNLKYSHHLRNVIKLFSGAVNIWVQADHIYDNFLLDLNLSLLRKLTFQMSDPSEDVDMVASHLSAYYTAFRTRQMNTTCFIPKLPSELEIGWLLESRLADPDWCVLEQLDFQDPIGPRDSLRLLRGEVSFQDIAYEELNFHHGKSVALKLRKATLNILHSRNARFLKKLCVSICLLTCQNCLLAEEAASSEEAAESDEERVECRGPASLEEQLESAQNDPDITCERCHTAEHFLTNCPELEELEVWHCFDSKQVCQLYPFSLIGNLRKLKRLTLVLPDYICGDFLPNVLRLCQKLEELRIKAHGWNQFLHDHVCKALPQAKCLRDFRYQNNNPDVYVDDLIKSLNLLETRKLQRIAIFCEFRSFTNESIRHLLDKNPQLVVFYICVRNSDQRVIKQFEKDHPSKVFLIEQQDHWYRQSSAMPDLHYREMVCCDGRVATLNAFYDFCDF